MKRWWLCWLGLIGSVSATTDPLTFVQTQAIPQTTTIGSVSTAVWRITSQLCFTMPTPLSIQLITTGPGFSTSDQCSGQRLAPQATCEISVQYVAQNPGDAFYRLIAHLGPKTLPLPTQHTRTVAVPQSIFLVGSVTQPLPSETLLGFDYPVTFSFFNPDPVNAATGLNAQVFPDFTIQSNSCSGTLAPQATCTISGTFSPSVFPGPTTLTASITYDQNPNPAIVTAQTLVVTSTAFVVVTQTLPEITVASTDYPVQFTLNNTNDFAITQIQPQWSAAPDGASFTPTSTTCGTDLAPHSTCVFNGIFHSGPNPGAGGVTLTLSYAQRRSADVLTNQTTVALPDVQINTTTALPPEVPTSNSFPVAFEVLNNSPFDLTNLQPTYPQQPPGSFTPGSGTTCLAGMTLPVQGRCVIEGTYQSGVNTAPGSVSVDLDFNERGGLSFTQTTQTQVSDPNVIAQVVPGDGLPAQIATGTAHSIQFRLLNESNFPISNIQISTTPLPVDASFVITGGTCNNGMSLGSGGSCNVLGTYTAGSTSGPGSAQVSFAYNESSTPAQEAAVTTISDPIVLLNPTTGLPAQTATGWFYEVSMTLTNNSAFTITELTPNPTNWVLDEQTTCETTLGPGQTCLYNGWFISDTPGPGSADLSVSYAESTNPATATSATNASDASISIVPSQALPDPISTSSSHPVTFTVTNNSLFTVTGLTPNWVSVPVASTPTGGTCGAALAPSANCTYTGTFVAGTTAATGGVSLNLTVDQSAQTFSAETQTHITESDVQVVLDTPLDPNISTQSAHPVQFQLVNQNGFAITNIVPTPTASPSDASFTPNPSSPCLTSSTLNAGASCTYFGIYQSGTTTGAGSVSVSFSYAQGNPKSNSTSTQISAPLVSLDLDEVERLPSQLSIDAQRVVTFHLTNNSAFTITGITHSVPVTTPAGNSTYTVNDDACGASLAAGQSCQLRGTYQGTATGSGSVSVTYTFDQGNAAQTSSTTLVNPNDVVTSLVDPLPSQMSTNDSQTVHVQLINQGNVPLTGIVVTPTTLPSTGVSFTPDAGSTCLTSTTLNVGATCDYSGVYTTNGAPAGPGSIDVNFQYNEPGSPKSIQSDTNLSAPSVNLSLNPDLILPAQSSTSTIYPVGFILTNNSLFTITNLTPSVTPSAGSSATLASSSCGSTLAPGADCFYTYDYTTASSAGAGSLDLSVSYDQETTPAQAQSTTTTSAPVVNLTATQGLPPQTSTHTRYPVTFTLTNNSAFPITVPVETMTIQPSDATGTLDSGTCAPETPVPAGGSCTYVGRYLTGATTGSGTFALDVVYSESTTPANASTTTTISAPNVALVITADLPVQMSTNSSATVQWTLTNNSAFALTQITPTFTTTPASAYTPDGNTTCTATLASGASCLYSGTYQAGSSALQGKIDLSVSFNEMGTTPKTATLKTNITAPKITVDVDTALPPNLSTNSEDQVVSFTINNKGAFAVTNLQLTPTKTPADATFDFVTTDCTTGLNANTSCTYTGNYRTGTTAGSGSVTLTATYAQSSTASSNQTTTTISVPNVTLVGDSTKKLPNAMPLNGVTPIQYTLTNNSTYPITGITPTIQGTGGTYTANSTDTTCGATLAVGANCLYVGTYTAGGTAGTGTLSANVTYAESPSAATATEQTTTVVAATATVTANPDLPATLALNATHTLTFTLTNTSPFSLTNVTGAVTSVMPSGATYTPSGCQGVTLAPNETCVYTGNYSSSAQGTGQVAVNFAFTQSPGSKTASSAATTVIGKVIYAGTSGLGLWRSVDGGGTFAQIATTSITNAGTVNTLSFFSSAIYAGTGNGLYRSTDGTNFDKIAGSSIGSNAVNALFVSGGKLYVGVDNHGVFASANGTDFNPIDSGTFMSDAPSIFSFTSLGSNLYVGTIKGLYRSTNGTNFLRIAPQDYSIFNLAVYALIASGSNVYAGAGTSSSSLFYSTNGTDFTKLTSSGVSSGTTIFSLTVSGSNVYVGTGGLFRSTDATHFNQIATDSIGNRQVRSLFVGPTRLYAGVSSGLYASTDGTTGTNFTQLADTTLGSRTIYSVLEH